MILNRRTQSPRKHLIWVKKDPMILMYEKIQELME